MRIVILTGISGAGKTTALKMMEDMGYYCMDNLPVGLMESFCALAENNKDLSRVAAGIDIRNGQHLEDLLSVISRIEYRGHALQVLFLESDDATLLKRYKETRRSHPLAENDSIEKGIARERDALSEIKKRADFIIDTSKLLTRELNTELKRIFLDNETFKNLNITVESFGFKYGVPSDADLVFDVRFMPNPYYVEELRTHTGMDKDVHDYVMASPVAQEFISKLSDMLSFLLPHYVSEGKNSLVIAVGCTGGKHRSVTIANEIFEFLRKNEGYGVRIEHRDIGKDALRGK